MASLNVIALSKQQLLRYIQCFSDCPFFKSRQSAAHKIYDRNLPLLPQELSYIKETLSCEIDKTSFAKKTIFSSYMIDGLQVNLNERNNYHDLEDNKSDSPFLLPHLIDALWLSKIVIEIPAQVYVKEPIYLSVYASFAAIEKIIIVVHSFAHVTIIDDRKHNYQSSLRGIDLIVQKNAQVKFYYQQEACFAKEYTYLAVYAYAHASVEIVPLLKEAQQCCLQLDAILLGEWAAISVRGAYVLKKNQRYVIMVRQVHKEVLTKSFVQLHGIIDDEAQCFVHGTIEIPKNSQKSESRLVDKNILLSSQAKAVAIPCLEVKTHNVQCSHGTAIGPLDDEMIFYLMVRGFSKKQACAHLVEAFLQEVCQEDWQKSFFNNTG